MICQIINIECCIGNATRICQSLSIIVIFQLKSWPDSIFFWFCRLEINSTLSKSNLAFFMLIIRSFLNFMPIPRILNAKRIRGISGNFCILKIFHFNFWKPYGYNFIKHGILNVGLWGRIQEDITNLSQFWYHMTLVLIFQVRSWTDSIVCCFCGLEINFNSENWQTGLRPFVFSI